jgi:hypothetical protein
MNLMNLICARRAVSTFDAMAKPKDDALSISQEPSVVGSTPYHDCDASRSRRRNGLAGLYSVRRITNYSVPPFDQASRPEAMLCKLCCAKRRAGVPSQPPPPLRSATLKQVRTPDTRRTLAYWQDSPGKLASTP